MGQAFRRGGYKGRIDYSSVALLSGVGPRLIGKEVHDAKERENRRSAGRSAEARDASVTENTRDHSRIL
jgi:hypothetical protein